MYVVFSYRECNLYVIIAAVVGGMLLVVLVILTAVIIAVEGNRGRELVSEFRLSSLSQLIVIPNL